MDYISVAGLRQQKAGSNDANASQRAIDYREHGPRGLQIGLYGNVKRGMVGLGFGLSSLVWPLSELVSWFL